MKTSEKIKQLREEGYTVPEISEKLSLGKGTIGYHLNRLKLSKLTKYNRITEEKWNLVCSEEKSMAAASRRLEIPFTTFRRYVEKFGYYRPNPGGKDIKRGKYLKTKEIGDFKSRNSVKRFILENNLLEYKCSNCGLETWDGKPIILHLDHINGKSNDHRLENLRFLCPNCHSQTETYTGKNIGKHKPV